jgi:hypothetical protein
MDIRMGEQFNGGFVFEYSVEKVYSEQTSPYPFLRNVRILEGRYGIGYLTVMGRHSLRVHSLSSVELFGSPL